MKIKTRVTTDPDLSGYKFYIEAGYDFDSAIYEKHYNVKLKQRDINRIDKLSKRLRSYEWLQVYHSI